MEEQLHGYKLEEDEEQESPLWWGKEREENNTSRKMKQNRKLFQKKLREFNMTKGLGESSFHNIMCWCLPVTTGLYFYFEIFKTYSWSVGGSSFGKVLVLQVQGAEFKPQNHPPPHTHTHKVFFPPALGKRRMRAMNRIYWPITLAELVCFGFSEHPCLKI